MRCRPALAAALLLALVAAGCGPVQISHGPRGVPRPAALPPSVRAVWIDAPALFDSLGTPERLRAGLERLARTGFTDVVVEVKPYAGEVLYPSQIAPRLVAPDGPTPDPAWDVAADAVAAGRALGLRVHLALNVFAEGDHARRSGTLYDRHPTWQTTVVGADGTPRPSTRLRPDERTGDVAFSNPVRPDVRNTALSLLAEATARYEPDGVLLDRMRFESAAADVSPESREAFERWHHAPVARWPADVLATGPLYPQWLEWRALSMQTFAEAARAAVRGAYPTTRLGLAAPADYAAAAEVGLNWAAASYDAHGDYPWATPTFYEKSLIGFFDVLVPEASAADTALLRTVERRVARVARVVPRLSIALYPTADAFARAARLTLDATGGVLVSTYSDLARRPGVWAALGRAFPAPETAAVR